MLVAFSATPVLVMLFYRHPMLLLCLFPITNAIFGTIYYEFVTGRFVFMPTDVLYFFTITTLGLCALLRPRKIAAALKENIFLSMFLALLVLYVVLYTPVYGQSAIGEARKFYFFFLIPLLAAVAIKTPADLRRFVLTIVWATAGIAIFGIGTAVATGDIFRPISAQGALSLALAALLVLIHRMHRIVLMGSVIDKCLLNLFFAGAITAGHRTVWLAIGSGLVLTCWLYGRKQALLAKVLMLVFIMIVAMGLGIALFPDTAARLGTAFQGILNPQKDATASWRIEGWQMHLDRLTREGKFLFGEGLGGYYGRDAYSGHIPVPHSAYVELVLKLGLLGLALYGFLTIEFVRKALAVRKTLPAGPMKAWLEASILCFGAAHAYCSGYSFDAIMFMFLAVAQSVQRLSKLSPTSHPAEYKIFQRTETSQAAFPLSGAVSPRANPVSQNVPG